MNARRAAILAALLSLALSACKKKEGDVDGIGEWHIGKTKVSEGFVCTPWENGMTFCSNQPPKNIADHTASVDLYFRGHGEDAPLVEILLAVQGACNTEAIDKWLSSRLGSAPTRRGMAFVWPGKAATVAALLPATDGECRVHFLDPKDETRLAELEKESQKAP